MKKKELYKIFKEIKNKILFSDNETQTFLDNLSKFLNNIRIHSNNEENLKNDLKEFLSKFFTNYINNKPISIRGISATDIDLAIFDSSEKIENDKVRVIFETKQPNSQDMINEEDFNRKSMHETVLYYLIEKMEFKNDLIENIIITDYLNWFIIKSEDYKINFFNNKKIMQIYQEYRNKKGDGTVNSTNYFYSECKKLLSKNPSILDNLSYVHIDLSKLGDIFKIDTGRNYDFELTIKEFLIIFRYILSPPFLLHESLAYRNANQLNKTFYNILLNIIGVEEKKEENKLKIVLDKTNKDSLIQKIIEKISRKKIISSKEKEQEVFEHALGICLVWINRLLFIKLLEAYLLKINCPTKDLEEYYIISKKKIKDFNDLDNLFFDILAKEKHDVDIFKHVPYLNSSLFELSDLEKTYSITIGDFHDYSVKNNKMLEVYSKLNKRKIAQENFVNLIIDFLNFYDFGSEKESHKTDNLINASVLGLIFEKINGYKEGSYYTPSQVTEFISKETISRAVLDKINLYLKKHSKLEQNSLNSLKNLIIRNKDDNDFLLGISEALYDIKICDPAVGSGHFLVSALNDLLMIRCDLGLTFGKEKNYVKLYCEYDNFRELQFYKDYECKKEVKYTRDNLSFNYQEEQETIFYIKKRVIESSLYGVDINPNSIEICRLRLWIELLKNVYYKDGKMETLPNIDINIKPGDSLINHIPLEYRMKDLAYFSDHIREYKKLVSKYKEEQDKSLKNEITKKIKQITDKLETSMIDKSIERLKKQIKKHEEEASQQTLNFDKGLFVKKKINKEIKEKINKIQENIEGLEKKKEIFNNSFEWAIEFPDLLDEDSNFIGFDAMILNPPYISTTEINSVYNKEKIDHVNFHFFKKKNNGKCLFNDLYELFFYRCFELTKKESYIGIISSDSFLTTGNFESFREGLLDKNLLIWKPCPPDTFRSESLEGPSISTSILVINNFSTDEGRVTTYERPEHLNSFDEMEYYSVNKQDYKDSIRKSFWVPSPQNTEIFNKIIQKRNENEFINFENLVLGYSRMETPNNSEYIAVLDSDKRYADNARRYQKEYGSQLPQLSANGKLHGKIWKVIKESDITEISRLSDDEKTDGTKGKWILFTKGSGVSALEKNKRYCSKMHYYIYWDKTAIKHYGMAGKEYFWKKGVYWSLATESKEKSFIINPKSRLKFSLKNEGPNDVNFKAAVLKDDGWLYYLLGILNTRLIFKIKWNFINSSTANQQCDINLIPIKKPNEIQKKYIEEIVKRCVQIQKNNLSKVEFKGRLYTLKSLEKEIDEKVLEIYGLNAQLFKEEIEEDLSENDEE
jgi:hypothetical protein